MCRRAPVPRDYQRTRVYRWEAEHVFPLAGRRLDLAFCRALVLEVYRFAEADRVHLPGWRPPVVTDGRGRRHACGSREVIKLPRWARTVAVVLHECAHGLAPDRHGPLFVGVYVELLVRFAGLSRRHLLATLARAGIDVEPEALATLRGAFRGSVPGPGRTAAP
jgi:hypothetical protein